MPTAATDLSQLDPRRYIQQVPLARLAAVLGNERAAVRLKSLYALNVCPECFADNSHWRYDVEGAVRTGQPSSRRCGGIRVVRWRCQRCQATFERAEAIEYGRR